MQDLQNICRVCLQRKPDNFSIFSSIKSEYIPNVIYNISGVKVSSSAEPGTRICRHCATSVVEAQRTILRCQESEEFLAYKMLSRPPETKDTTELESSADQWPKSDKSYSEQNFSSQEEEEYDATCSDPNAVERLDSSQDFADDVTEQTTLPPMKRGRRPKAETSNAKSFFCEHCDFETKVGKQLIAHNSDKHQIDDKNIYRCTLCPERFSWKPKLYRHIQRDHNTLPEDKKYICNECGNAYTREVHLKEHHRQRHQPRRFKCADPNCEQTFTRAFTLRRHYLSAHTNKTPYHCTLCDKYFKIYDMWKYHNEVVHKNAIVYCPRCGYPFRFKEKLEEHLEKDVCRRSVVPCPYCQRRFTARAGLREHLRKIHSMN